MKHRRPAVVPTNGWHYPEPSYFRLCVASRRQIPPNFQPPGPDRPTPGIWTQIYSHPSLTRILEADIDLGTNPVTDEEAIFLNFLIQHLSATYRAMKKGLFKTQQPIQGDIRWFFALPIPKSVWLASRSLLEPDFVEFVEKGIEEST